MAKTTHYDFYDYLPYWRKRKYEHEAEKTALKKFLVKNLSKNLTTSKQGSIIDIGGGFGRLAEIYTPLFKNCLLIDPSKKILKQAKIRLKNYKNVEIKQGSVQEIPAKDNQFDAALMVRIVHHIPEPLPAFREINRVLKPRGFLILEFANKIHFRAKIRAWLRGNFGFSKNLNPVDQRSQKSIDTDKIPFLNHHPQQIEKLLTQAGFKVIDKLSVSNFRHPLFKKMVPLRLLSFLESNTQHPLSIIYFGPSIFILASKI